MPMNALITDPLVSIIIITYHSEKYVLETLESVKNQTYNNIELIITDDGSSDHTIKICQNWLSVNEKRFVNTHLVTVAKNSGIPANCNRGIKVSTGSWIKMIAGDDVLLPHCIKFNVDYILAHPNSLFLHSKVQKYKNSFEKGNELRLDESNKFTINDRGLSPADQLKILLHLNQINAPTVFMSKDVFDKVGLFNEKYKLWEDRPMWLEITNYGIKLEYLDEITVNYRVTDNSATFHKKADLIFGETDLQKDEVILNYRKYLDGFEFTIKFINYKRKQLLYKLGLNKNNLLGRILNKVTGYFLVRSITKINQKYELKN